SPRRRGGEAHRHRGRHRDAREHGAAGDPRPAPSRTGAMTAVARLEMTGVRKRFGATVALDGVDLCVAPGECHALVGQNGAGKSTLMKVLSGAIAADEGTMKLDGAP